MRFYKDASPTGFSSVAFARQKSNLFLEAGARWLADVLVDGPVVHADRGLGEIAPEMAGSGLPVFLVREGFLRRRAGEHYFRPQMFAENRVHGFNLSA
jgi:hypothetical protein